MKHILIVEDEPSLANALKQKLIQKHFKISVVHDGQSALEFIENESVDLILLDIILPIVNGFNFLMKEKVSTSIFILSNLEEKVIEDKLKEFHLTKKVDQIITKANLPIHILAELIKDFLDKKQKHH